MFPPLLPDPDAALLPELVEAAVVVVAAAAAVVVAAAAVDTAATEVEVFLPLLPAAPFPFELLLPFPFELLLPFPFELLLFPFPPLLPVETAAFVLVAAAAAAAVTVTVLAAVWKTNKLPKS